MRDRRHLAGLLRRGGRSRRVLLTNWRLLRVYERLLIECQLVCLERE